MPKSVVLGNGSLAVGLDTNGLVRDFYYPYVGLENHVGGHNKHRIGVWVAGQFSWMDDGSWDIQVGCSCDVFESTIIATHEGLGIRLNFSDVVYNEKNIFLRRVYITNLRNESREIRLFFAQEFEIYEAHRGDAVYYDPRIQAVVHYNGKRVFLINAQAQNSSFNDYTTGIFGIYDKAGSFRDAEDGVLSQNPVEHGPTDSVLALHLSLDPEGVCDAYYWVAAAESIQEAEELNADVVERKPSHLIKTTGDFWHAWVHRYKFKLDDLSPRAIDVFRKSMFYIRVHADNNGGIIASSDSDMFRGGKDTYAYVWPRDGAFVSLALDSVGAVDITRRFYEFMRDVVRDEGYFMHKYRPDRSLGSSWHPWIQKGKVSLPIQEDETALVLVALWRHFEVSRDIEFIESLYNPLINKAALFLMGYRDVSTGLPKASYDLWEEKFGVHTFTASAVYGGLVAASKFAKLLGKTMSQRNFEHTAEEMRRSIVSHLWNDDRGAFYKSINYDARGSIVPDLTLDSSSLYGITTFGVLPYDDEKVLRMVHAVEEGLQLKTQTGGFVRYENDNYYRADHSLLGNSWIITSLWMAQYYLLRAKGKRDIKKALEWIEWVAEHALDSGVLPEQLHPHTGEHISAAPLTWSHGEYIKTVTLYLETLERLGLCDNCSPLTPFDFEHYDQ